MAAWCGRVAGYPQRVHQRQHPPASWPGGYPRSPTATSSSAVQRGTPITIMAGTLSSANYDFPNLVNGAFAIGEAST